jgi:putative transposase
MLAKAFGSTRWLYNYLLNLHNETYKATGKGLTRNQMQKLIPCLKKDEETIWLSETYSQCLQVVCLHLSDAFRNFFQKRTGYPKFKSKFGKQSLTYPQNIKIVGKDIKFPKLGLIHTKLTKEIKFPLKTVVITMNSCGQYFASLLFDNGIKQPQQSTNGKAIGIDLGLTHFAITSDGSKFANPKWFKKHENNLKIKQQKLSRKAKSSNNRNKARRQVAVVHNKIANCRADYQHKLSRRIVNENQIICVENLAISNMVKNRKLSKAISQVGWGSFLTMLKYKAEQEGKIYVEVDRFFPSSKICNVCLNQIKHLSLDIRYWDCPSCFTHHDRDITASKNIRDEGLRILLASGTGATAYRPNVKLDGAFCIIK